MAGDEARAVWGMGPLQKFASKRVEICYNLSGRRWLVSLVRVELKQLEVSRVGMCWREVDWR